MNKITESAIEKFAIELLEKQGCHYIYAPDIAPDSDSTGTMHRATTRQSFEDVLLMERLQTAVGRIKPQWHNDDLKKGVIKVVMTSVSSAGPEISRHHTTKDQRRALADRMKDPEDELKLVIVRDTWLTGFDVPCMHTLYIDKPMKRPQSDAGPLRGLIVFIRINQAGLWWIIWGLHQTLKKHCRFTRTATAKATRQ